MALRPSHKVYASGQHANATICERPDFDAETAAKDLRNAMKGMGTNEETIVNVLGNYSSSQRCEIKTAYVANFGKDLVEELKSEISGDFLQLCEYCLEPWYDMCAKALYDAISGAGTKESVIIETLCTLSGEEIQEVKEAYTRLLSDKGEASGRDLEKDIKGDLSGNIERLIVAILQGQRNELSEADIADYVQGAKSLKQLIDMNQVYEDVKEIYEAGEGSFGTDEAMFISKFCSRNKFHLWAISEVYEQEYGKTLLEAVDGELSGDVRTALKLLFTTQLDPKVAFSKLLQEALSGAGTSDKKLMRIIVSRSEVDLKDIMEQYEADTEKSLVEAIKGDTSGDYRSLLLLLCGENPSE